MKNLLEAENSEKQKAKKFIYQQCLKHLTHLKPSNDDKIGERAEKTWEIFTLE